jgi:demethylmenaquinone methyltransferase/2-methoxy-6-polyprenyl-1,4-benzoquinol methylase
MLALAKGKLRRRGLPVAPAAGDALALPFAAGIFAAVTVAFGVRNVEDPAAALAEIHRVLAPGGRVLILEFAVPRRPVIRSAYLLYFRHVLPAIASLTSKRGPAYRYLRDSVLAFPQREAFRQLIERAGLVDATWQELSGGTVCLYEARKP